MSEYLKTMALRWADKGEPAGPIWLRDNFRLAKAYLVIDRKCDLMHEIHQAAIQLRNQEPEKCSERLLAALEAFDNVRAQFLHT